MRYDHLGMLPEDAFKEDPLGRTTKEGGGSGSSTTTTNTVTKPPKWAVWAGREMLNEANSYSNRTPFYYNQSVADPGYYQNQAYNLAKQADNNTAGFNSANNYSNYIYGSGFQNQGMGLADNLNPYYGRNVGDIYNSQMKGGGYTASNPYIGGIGEDRIAGNTAGSQGLYDYIDSIGSNIGQVNPLMNPFYGPNDYLEGMIDTASGDVTENYLNTINPKLDSMDRMAGAFGNTGVADTRSEAQEDLAQELAQINNQYRFQDYTTQQQLGENMVNRDLDAQRFNATTGLDLGMQKAGLFSNLAQFDAGQLQNAATTNAANDLTAEQLRAQFGGDLSQFNAGQLQDAWQQRMATEGLYDQFNANMDQANFERNAALWDAMQNNQLDMYNNINNLRYSMIPQTIDLNNNAWTDAENMMKFGLQDQDYRQMLYDNQYQNALNNYNAPLQNWDVLANAYRTALGGGGSSTLTQSGGGSSGLSNFLGGGLLASSLF